MSNAILETAKERYVSYVKELIVQNPAITGTTYYNQVSVSGTMNPDATGTYAVGGMYNNLPYYQKGSTEFFIWYDSTAGFWRLVNTPTVGNYNNPSLKPRWVSSVGTTNMQFTRGIWNHFAYTYDGSLTSNNLLFYLNGQLTDTKTMNKGAVAKDAGTMRIGRA